MRTLCFILGLLAVAWMVSPASFAATSYVVTNDDNCQASNTASVYALNNSNGTLTLLKVLDTGGVGNCGGFVASVGASLSQDARCLYVYNGGSSDIAAFKVPSLIKTGNYSNPALNAGFPGGSMAMTPDGKYLYATYAGTLNIGAWKRNADCSLTFVNSYTAAFGADTYSNIVVDPSGKGVIVSVDSLGALELFLINQATGALTDLGSADLNTTACASGDGCFPTGLDITKKELVIAGNAVLGASAFTVQLIATKPYFTQLKYVDLTNSANLCNAEVPWLTAAAYQNGSGPLFFGFSGFGTGCQPGVLATTLSPSGITIGGATPINSPNLYDGLIQSTGQWMVVSELFNQLQVFKINADGTLTATSQGPVTDDNANGALSFFIYPRTR